MGYLHRPRLTDPTPPPDDEGARCAQKSHEDACPGCGAQFGKTWWVKYYVTAKAVRESSETEKEI
jgi:hypothetical protein